MLTKTKFQCAQIKKTIGHFDAQFFDTVRRWSLPIFSDFVLNMKEDGVGFTEELIAIERVLTQFIQLAIMLFLQTLCLGVTKKCVYKKLYDVETTAAILKVFLQKSIFRLGLPCSIFGQLSLETKRFIKKELITIYCKITYEDIFVETKYLCLMNKKCLTIALKLILGIILIL